MLVFPLFLLFLLKYTAMKKSFHYFLSIFVLALMLFNNASVPDEFNNNKAIFTEEVSETKIVAENSNGDVDDLLTSHSPLPADIYLSNAIIFLKRSNLSDFSLPIRARAPPLM